MERRGYLRLPRIVLLSDDDTATRVVLTFLWNTEVGQMATAPLHGGGRGGGEARVLPAGRGGPSTRL